MPYTYVITHIPTGMRYYGVRFARGCTPQELGVSYFSSSKRLKLMIKKAPAEFSYQIRQTFDSADRAIEWENKFLRKTGVHRRDDWFNTTNNKSINFPKAYLAMSEEEKMKLSSSRRTVALAAWKAKTDEQKKAAMSRMHARRSPPTSATKKLISKKAKERWSNAEYKKAASQSMSKKKREFFNECSPEQRREIALRMVISSERRSILNSRSSKRAWESYSDEERSWRLARQKASLKSQPKYICSCGRRTTGAGMAAHSKKCKGSVTSQRVP